MKVDILYPAKGRLLFTQHTFPALIENTNWGLVNRLFVYDDGSAKRDRHWLAKAAVQSGVNHKFKLTTFGSPVAVMNDYLDYTEADVVAKIDNDIVVCPGWLEAMLGVMEANPRLGLLGMEPGMGSGGTAVGLPDDWDGTYSHEPCSHIGGVGLFRVATMKRYPRPHPNGRFGGTEWQHKYKPKRSWITPDLQVFGLDRVPVKPWTDYSMDYTKAGVQRHWNTYPKEMRWYWEWQLGKGKVS